jgi:hypothetical protein
VSKKRDDKKALNQRNARYLATVNEIVGKTYETKDDLLRALDPITPDASDERRAMLTDDAATFDSYIREIAAHNKVDRQTAKVGAIKILKKLRSYANEDKSVAFMKGVDKIVAGNYANDDELAAAIQGTLGSAGIDDAMAAQIRDRTVSHSQAMDGFAKGYGLDVDTAYAGVDKLTKKLLEVRALTDKARGNFDRAESVMGDESLPLKDRLDRSNRILDVANKQMEKATDGIEAIKRDGNISVLYHYTSTVHWGQIQESGFIKLGDSYISPGLVEHGYKLMPEVVILTDQPNLTPAMAGWAHESVMDKTKVRIAVAVKDAEPWLDYARSENALDFWIESLTRTAGEDGPEHWYVVRRPIFSSEWISVHIGDTEVSKSVIKTSAQPEWMTSEGSDGLCDFCCDGERNPPTAAYRHECAMFEIDGWTNGDPYTNNRGEADWGACWECSNLIQAKDTANLIARTLAHMSPTDTVGAGSKAGTDTGLWDPDVMTRRVTAFMRYRTGKRTFIGRCDFCFTHGETVKWLYNTEPYVFAVSVFSVTDFGRIANVKSLGEGWLSCDQCSRLVDRNNRKALQDRVFDRMIGRMEERLVSGYLSAGNRGRIRTIVTQWLDQFLAHCKQPRIAIPDLPKPRAIQLAPIPAQAALMAKLTLHRWLRSSDGRAYLGGWFDKFNNKAETGRDAVAHEIDVFDVPIKYGEAFYVESHIADSIREAAAQLQGSDVPWAIKPELLPSPSGFFYSDHQLAISAERPVRAIGWTVVERISKIPSIVNHPREPSWEITMFKSGNVDPAETDGVMLTFWGERRQDKTLRPTGQILWPFNVDYRSLDTVDGEYDYEHPELAFASLLAFIQQRIVVAGHPMGVGSAVRKTIEREVPEHAPEVRVITLRRVQRMDYKRPEESSGRQLSVQFMVRGFWRNQCYSPHLHHEFEETGVGCKDHQGKYVSAHWRGPDDAPIKQPSIGSVFDLAR